MWPEPSIETLPLLADHVPPVAVSLNVLEDPGQTVEIPVIVVGVGITVTIVLVVHPAPVV